MKYELKTLTHEFIPAALQKAERYRLLNEPQMAESICLDILATEPTHELALVNLLLAITDQFGHRSAASVQEARDVLPRMNNDYDRAYYGGIICERWAKAQLHAGSAPGHATRQWFLDALSHFERAELLAPAGNQDAVLRWNACVRILEQNPHLRAKDVDEEGYSDLP
jgi:hypothetical protein